MKVVLLGILLAFLLATSVYLGYFKLKNFFISEEVVVPNLVGMEEKEAKEKIEELGLQLVVKARVKIKILILEKSFPKK